MCEFRKKRDIFGKKKKEKEKKGKKSYGEEAVKEQPFMRIRESMEKNVFYFQHKINCNSFQYSYVRINYFTVVT